MKILKSDGTIEEVALNQMYSDGIFHRRITPSGELRKRFFVTIRKDGTKGVEIYPDEEAVYGN